MDLPAPNGQRTLFDVGCTKRKRSEGNGQPGELCIRQNPTLAQRVAECERVLAAAVAAKPPPPPPGPVGRPRLERPACWNAADAGAQSTERGRGRGRGRKRAWEELKEIDSETSESSDGEMEEGEWTLTGLDNTDATTWSSQNLA